MLDLEKLLKVVDPEPVLVNQQGCLRARHARSSCRACFDACPTDAIGVVDRRLTVDSSRCTRCGLCLGACPTAALAVRGVDESQLSTATEVRCAKAGGGAGSGAVLPCLGALHVEHLIDLGSRIPGITLTAGDCATCPLKSGGEQASQRLAAAAEMLKRLGVEEPPLWRTAGPDAASTEQSISRRDLLALWGQGAVQTGRSLLPEQEVNPVKLPSKVPARRLRWLKRFVVPAHTKSLPWPTRQVGEGCIGCDICVAFCPTGALAGSTGEDAWRLTFQPAACVDCRTCIDLCPRRVVSAGEEPSVRELLDGSRRELITVPLDRRPNLGGYRPPR